MNILKKVSINMYNTRFPLLNSEYFDNIENKEEYLNEYSMYNYLLLMFLIKNTSIKRIDNEIKNCREFKSEFKCTFDEDKDLYQYLCDGELSYFYIRNNLYIERLSAEEKKYLDSLISSSNFEFNEESEKFIKDTFMKVISEETKNNHESSYYLNFGPSDSRTFFALNNSIVIGARFYPGMDSNDKEDFEKNYYARLEYFSNKCEELEKLLKSELGKEASVIEYDSDSVNTLALDESVLLK